VRSLRRTLVALVLLTDLASAPRAAQIVINAPEASLLRGPNGDGMAGIGTLARGSIIEIPDKYTQKRADGTVDLELTTLKWLREASIGIDQPGLREIDDQRREYYFPVKVVKYAAGSRIPPEGTPTYIAFRFLVRQGGALVANEHSPLYSEKDIETAREANSEPTLGDEDWKPSSPLPRSHGKPREIRKPQLAGQNARDVKAQEARLSSAIGLYHRQKFICNIPRRRFLKRVNDEGEKVGIPRGLLTRLMFLESGGVCLRRGDWDEERRVHLARGLFQIHANTKRANIPWCTTAQETRLKGYSSWEQYEKGPRCLSNPIINLAEAIHVLKNKQTALIGRGARAKGYRREELLPDQLNTWRLVLSAYNGGHTYVLAAKTKLEQFNRKHGTQLNAANWDDLKLFYFEAWLKRAPASASPTAKGTRSRKNTITNVGYVDSLLPPEIGFGKLARYD
jgi:hypothetical protein